MIIAGIECTIIYRHGLVSAVDESDKVVLEAISEGHLKREIDKVNNWYKPRLTCVKRGPIKRDHCSPL